MRLLGFLFGSVLVTSVALAAEPKVLAKSAILIEASSGRVLFEKNADAKLPPASTTKIVTALLVLENKPMDELLFAAKDAKEIGGSSLYMKKGESITYEDALYAIMLRSANDVCYSVATAISGSERNFAKLMTLKAAELGARSTQFTNSNGLPDPNHYSTARDLATIAMFAMKDDTFAAVAGTRKREIKRSMNDKDHLLVSRNKYLFKDPTADGIKTGYTDAAGHCYVGSVSRNGFRVITVLLNSPDTQVEHQAMVDWAFAQYKIGRKVEKGEVIAEAPVRAGVKSSVPLVAQEELLLLQPVDSVEPLVAQPSVSTLVAPVDPARDTQTISFVTDDGYRAEVKVAPQSPVAELPRITQIAQKTFAPDNAAVWVIGALMLSGAFALRRRPKRY